MTVPDSDLFRDAGDADAAWRRIVAVARTSPPSLAESPPDGFADFVLALARRERLAASPAEEERRILSWGAILAIAASLLVAVSSWSDLSSLVASHSNVLFEELTRWEPLP
ncbi:MAG: hypothetical protein JNK76_09755 [Planctomycetales bacterium]|nr:hypothetical protein [Planctomycetales bacterium]